MLIAAAGTNSGIYKFFFVLHILCAIVGFGGVLLNGLYTAQAKKRPVPEGLAINEANMFVAGRVAEMFIYAVFVIGIVLVALSDKAWKFDQGWLSASMALYIIGLGVAHGVLIRGQKRIIELQRQLVATPAGGAEGRGGPPPQVAEIDRISQRMSIAGAFNSILLVVILFLMVWKPGR